MRRKRQMQRMSRSLLQSLAADLALDVSSFGDWSGSKEAGLASGPYSSLILTQQRLPLDLPVDRIGLHLLALFYRSLDDRLPTAARKHGIDALRRACQKLDAAVSAGVNTQQQSVHGSGDSTKANRSSKGPGQKDSKVAPNKRSVADSQDGSIKRLRKDPPALNQAQVIRQREVVRKSGPSSSPTSLPPTSSGGEKRLGTEREKRERQDLTSTSGSEQRQRETQKAKETSFETEELKRKRRFVPAQPGGEPQETSTREGPPPAQKSNLSGKGESEQRLVHAHHREGSKETLQQEGMARGPSSGKPTFQRANSNKTASPPQKSARAPPSQLEQNNRGNSVVRRANDVAPPQQKSACTFSPRREKNANRTEQPPQGRRSLKNITLLSREQRPIAHGVGKLTGNNQHQGNFVSHSMAAAGGVASNGEAVWTAANIEPGNNGTTPTALTPTTSPGENSPIPSTEKGIPDQTNSTSDAPCLTAKTTNEQCSAPTTKNAKTGNVFQDDVIDLTDDSPLHEPRSSTTPPPAATKMQCDKAILGRRQAIPQPSAGTALKRPPSPPASPLSPATVHSPPPAPAAAPRPFAERRSLLLYADGNLKGGRSTSTASCSLQGRPSCVVSFDAGFHLDGSGSCLDNKLCIDVSERLRTWDPYWKIIEVSGNTVLNFAFHTCLKRMISHSLLFDTGIRNTSASSSNASGGWNKRIALSANDDRWNTNYCEWCN